MNLVSIVILNWNGRKFLEKFLPSLLEHSALPGAEIVVADNASGDDSLEYLDQEFPSVRQIRLEENYGFSGGYNRALEQCDSKYYLLLNSDIEVTEGWLQPLLDLMESDEQVAACTPKILDYQQRSKFEYAGAGGGYLDRYGYPFCRGRIFDSLEEDSGQYNDPVEIFWGSGACLLVRAEYFRECGGLDEQFFAHMEEIDLCWRLKRRGYRIGYVGSSHVYHVGGGTLPKGNPRKTFLNFRNNLLLLYKNLPRKGKSRTLLVRMCLDGISALRFMLQGSPGDFRAVLKAHGAYYRLRKTYKKESGMIGVGALPSPSGQIYPHSIVFDYFLRGKKRFDQISHRFTQNS